MPTAAVQSAPPLVPAAAWGLRSASEEAAARVALLHRKLHALSHAAAAAEAAPASPRRVKVAVAVPEAAAPPDTSRCCGCGVVIREGHQYVVVRPRRGAAMKYHPRCVRRPKPRPDVVAAAVAATAAVATSAGVWDPVRVEGLHEGVGPGGAALHGGVLRPVVEQRRHHPTAALLRAVSSYVEAAPERQRRRDFYLWPPGWDELRRLRRRVRRKEASLAKIRRMGAAGDDDEVPDGIATDAGFTHTDVVTASASVAEDIAHESRGDASVPTDDVSDFSGAADEAGTESVADDAEWGQDSAGSPAAASDGEISDDVELVADEGSEGGEVLTEDGFDMLTEGGQSSASIADDVLSGSLSLSLGREMSATDLVEDILSLVQTPRKLDKSISTLIPELLGSSAPDVTMDEIATESPAVTSMSASRNTPLQWRRRQAAAARGDRVSLIESLTAALLGSDEGDESVALRSVRAKEIVSLLGSVSEDLIDDTGTPLIRRTATRLSLQQRLGLQASPKRVPVSEVGSSVERMATVPMDAGTPDFSVRQRLTLDDADVLIVDEDIDIVEELPAVGASRLKPHMLELRGPSPRTDSEQSVQWSDGLASMTMRSSQSLTLTKRFVDTEPRRKRRHIPGALSISQVETEGSGSPVAPRVARRIGFDDYDDDIPEDLVADQEAMDMEEVLTPQLPRRRGFDQEIEELVSVVASSDDDEAEDEILEEPALASLSASSPTGAARRAPRVLVPDVAASEVEEEELPLSPPVALIPPPAPRQPVVPDVEITSVLDSDDAPPTSATDASTWTPPPPGFDMLGTGRAGRAESPSASSHTPASTRHSSASSSSLLSSSSSSSSAPSPRFAKRAAVRLNPISGTLMDPDGWPGLGAAGVRQTRSFAPEAGYEAE